MGLGNVHEFEGRLADEHDALEVRMGGDAWDGWCMGGGAWVTLAKLDWAHIWSDHLHLDLRKGCALHLGLTLMMCMPYLAQLPHNELYCHCRFLHCHNGRSSCCLPLQAANVHTLLAANQHTLLAAIAGC